MSDSVRNAILVTAIAAATILLLVLPTGYESPYAQQVDRVRAKVLDVNDSDIQQFGIVKTGRQLLDVEILEGEHKGKVVEATNELLGKMETDKMFVEGDRAFVVVQENGGEVAWTTAYDHYRLDTELLLAVVFAILLVGFAGWAGARSLLSFVFAVVLVWRVLLPNVLMYRDPVLIAMIVVGLMAAATLYLVAGVNVIATVALLGSTLGIVLTYLLSELLYPLFNLHGAIQSFSETLLYTGYEDLRLDRLFLAAVFVGASGAVIDVAIDVSTSMSEVSGKRPDLSLLDLIRSGFAVGRNMTSTMVTTLLMAYISGYMALLLVFMAQGIPPANILNTNYVAAEILKTVVGSMGLVTTAPFTALIGGVIYTRRAHRSLAAPPVEAELAGRPVTATQELLTHKE
jgi:uncharacterized membrane protein